MKHLKKLTLLAALLGAAAAFTGMKYAEAGVDAHGRTEFIREYTDESVPMLPRAFYDFNVTQPEMMRDFLWVVDSTYDLLVSKGVRPSRIKFVVSLRGQSVSFATDDFGVGDPALEQVGEEIRGYLASLQAKGVRIEACLISCQWVGVDPDALFDGVAVIDNAFAAAMWYQNQKYATIPVHQLP